MTDHALDPAKKLVREYGGAVLVAVVVALVIRVFLIEAYKIPSSSMRPALEPGDTIFVSKLEFKPDYGQVVVFSLPADPRRDFIKRIIGLPGDTVQMKKG